MKKYKPRPINAELFFEWNNTRKTFSIRTLGKYGFITPIAECRIPEYATYICNVLNSHEELLRAANDYLQNPFDGEGKNIGAAEKLKCAIAKAWEGR